MPSVGMRRTTRVFGARVLRSGRRLWTSFEGKHLKAANGEKLIELIDNADAGGGGKGNGWHKNDVSSKKQVTKMDVDLKPEKKVVEPKLEKRAVEAVKENANVDRRWGAVYRRKRKRVKAFGGANKDSVGGRFGKHYVRKRWKKKARASPEDLPSPSGSLALTVVNSSRSSGHWIYCLLNSLLDYMRRTEVHLEQFFTFIGSTPIRNVFCLHGVLFLKEYAHEMRSGVCIISGVRSSVPQFTVSFSAIPCCFTYIHSSLSLRSVRPSYVLWTRPVAIDDICEEPDDTDDMVCDQSESNIISPGLVPSDNVCILSQPAVRVPKFATFNTHLRSGRTIQKRRRALRSKRTKRASVSLISDSLRFRQNANQLPSVSPLPGLRSSGNRSSAQNIKELKSALVESTQDLDATSCSANLLVIESDKCYREEGVIISLELSKQWTLAVEKGGVKRFNLTAEKVMRPCGSNRVTHDIVWTADNSWKLEFPDRRDWLIFKELYKECADRNVQPSANSTIPVPGVCEVSGYAESFTSPFARPDSYISVKTDELARALDSKSANYDMDTDDEEWLNEFNDQCRVENRVHHCISVERFESMIDSLEKSIFCNPDDYSDEKGSPNICLDSEPKEVAEAVYSYWCKKRKQKRSALIRVFQLYQPRRSLSFTKSFLRKKRSFKRQGSKAGRGKQRNILQALAAEQDAQQLQQSAILKVKEAKAAADRQEGLAVIKRQIAQQLMENADLATYKAMMALKIADAAMVGDSTENDASLLLS